MSADRWWNLFGKQDVGGTVTVFNIRCRDDDVTEVDVKIDEYTFTDFRLYPTGYGYMDELLPSNILKICELILEQRPDAIIPIGIVLRLQQIQNIDLL